MGRRLLAVSAGTAVLVFAAALWFSDHQKSKAVIAELEQNYRSLLTDKNNVLLQSVQLTRQNRELEQQNAKLVADNGILTEQKQLYSDGFADLYQKIDMLSEQVDQLQRANELVGVTSSDLEKEKAINKTLSDETERLRQELKRCEPH